MDGWMDRWEKEVVGTWDGPVGERFTRITNRSVLVSQER